MYTVEQVNVVVGAEHVISAMSSDCLKSFAFNTQQVRARLSEFLSDLHTAQGLIIIKRINLIVEKACS